MWRILWSDAGAERLIKEAGDLRKWDDEDTFNRFEVLLDYSPA